MTVSAKEHLIDYNTERKNGHLHTHKILNDIT